MIFLANKYWEVRKTKHKGNGIFIKKDISAGTIIGDYIGTIVRTKDIDFDSNKKNLYLMYYHELASIYPDLKKAGIHLLNHSCSPNSWLYTYKGHTLAFALRKIFAGEELTICYLLSPKGKFEKTCTHKCYCGSFNCCKTMHLSEGKFNKWRLFQETKTKLDKPKRICYGKTLKLLSKYPKSIADNQIYDLFGNIEKPAKALVTKTLPDINTLRKLIRTSGKTISLPMFNIKILGISDNDISSSTIKHS